MKWQEWKFSARLALEDRFMRWMAILVGVGVVGMSIFFLWKIIPEGRRSGVVTFHYTIYLGIDDVRPWPWILTVPGIALLFTAVDTILAFALFRQSVLVSRALMVLCAMSVIVWAIGSFFLVLINA